MEYAVAKVNAARVLGTVVKRNQKTTILKIDLPRFTPEEVIDLMITGTSINKLYYELGEKGLNRPGTIKRHNVKHQVVFC